MSNGPWTDEENDLIVADYFVMLADDIAGRPYNKAAHRRALLPLLNDRSEGSIEFKHQNISAVLKGLGEDWIPGYKPAFNFQMTLVDAVARWLALNPAWLGRSPAARPPTGLADAVSIWIGPPSGPVFSLIFLSCHLADLRFFSKNLMLPGSGGTCFLTFFVEFTTVSWLFRCEYG